MHFAMSASVHTLRDAITSGQASLTQLLRQTQLIAARLNVEDVGHWVALELKGYAQDVEPPGYRSVFTQSLEIYNSERDAWQFAGNLNFSLKARQPIAEIEDLCRVNRVDFPVPKNF